MFKDPCERQEALSGFLQWALSRVSSGRGHGAPKLKHLWAMTPCSLLQIVTLSCAPVTPKMAMRLG